MTIEQIISGWQTEGILKHLMWQGTFFGRDAHYENLPETLNKKSILALQSIEINKLLSHQKEAWKATQAGLDWTITVPHGAGRQLCFYLPVMDKIYSEPSSAVLYVLPSFRISEYKKSLNRINQDLSLNIDIVPAMPSQNRMDVSIAIDSTHIVLTTPSILHRDILPQHTAWASFLKRVKYVVWTDLDVYREEWAYHFKYILWRLERIFKFYQVSPQYFFSTSGTDVLVETASEIIDRPIKYIDQNGAAQNK